MEKNTETEIKLIIAKKNVKALVASPLVTKKTKKGSHKTVKRLMLLRLFWQLLV